MKTVKILIILFLVNLVTSACIGPSTADSAEKIMSPQNRLLPISGTWEVSRVLIQDASNKEDSEKWLHEKIQFSDVYASIGQSILEKPQYQIKRINGEQYLLFNPKSLPTGFVFPEKDLEVITVIDDDKFFCEVLIISEIELVLKIQNSSLYLNKISDRVDDYIYNEKDSKEYENISTKEYGKRDADTGVLIGLRSAVLNKEGYAEDYNYKTLWISLSDNELNPVLEVEDIFFPRRSGFWQLQLETATENHRTEQYIRANNVLIEENKSIREKKSKDVKDKNINLGSLSINLKAEKEESTQKLDFSRWGERLGEVTRKINYISNDFISVQTAGRGGHVTGNESWEENRLQLLHVDGLPNGQGVKISDILEETGVASIRSAWEETISNQGIDDYTILYKEKLLENFGLERRLGHWFLKGRINYIKDKEFRVTDYNINIIPPSKLVLYDTLHVPWTNIKDRVPRALDAYTSPDRDVAIVFTRDELLIYNIHGKSLARSPLERIGLNDGETVIMVEWARGQYVENWENTLKKVGAK